jgi:PAS domain S-box-containing protein
MDMIAANPPTERLEESIEYLRDLVDNVNDLIQSIRLDGSFLFVNRAWRETLGYSADEVEQLTVLDVIHPADRARYELMLRRLFAGETVGEMEIAFLASDGRVVALEGSVTCRFEHGRPVSTRGIYRDISERKRAEQEQRDSLECYRRLVDSSPDAIFVNRGDRLVFANPAMFRLLGAARPEQILGKGPFEIAHPDCHAMVRRRIAQVLETGRPVPLVEQKLVRVDGTPVDVEVIATPFYDHNGIAVLVMARDIRERKRAEQERRESEAKYRAIFENAVEGFFQSTPEGRFLTLNPALARIYGFASPEEVITHFEDIGHQLYLDPARRQEFRRKIDAEGVVQGFEFRIARKDGSCAWVSECARAVRDSAGRMLWYEGTVEDITERKLAEEALRESEEKWRTLAANVPDVICLLARDGTIQFINRILPGYEYDCVIGSTTYDYLSPESHDQVRAGLERLFNHGEEFEAELRGAGVSDAERWYHLRYSPVWRNGTVIAALNIGTDITERKRHTEERRRLEAQLQHAQKLESLGVLAGGIAHDFNNLLTSILGYASLALMQLPVESVACPLLREIEKAAQRAADLTQQMLAYSGRGKFIIQSLRLDALVQEMVKLLGAVVSKKARLNLDLEPASIEGDATQIRQVVMNLITNASDALEGQCGVIDVRTGVRHADTEFLRSPFLPSDLPAGTYAFVEVTDSGCGMTPETLARVFDPFFTTKFTGRGLGLAAVLGIVKGHRGTIKVDSELGHGTTFQVLLPCLAGPALRPVASNPGTHRRGRGTVLVVEDEPTIRTLAREILERAGFQVQEAADGCEGLDVFSAHQADFVAVLLDLTMPRMDGMEALREMRRYNQKLPVLVMSGYSDLEVSMRLAGLGANGFIQKPFQPRELVTRLCELLPAKGAGRRS